MIDLYIYIKLFNYVVRLFVTVACGCQDFLVSHIAYDLYITRMSSYRDVICLLVCGLISVYIFWNKWFRVCGICVVRFIKVSCLCWVVGACMYCGCVLVSAWTAISAFAPTRAVYSPGCMLCAA